MTETERTSEIDAMRLRRAKRHLAESAELIRAAARLMPADDFSVRGYLTVAERALRSAQEAAEAVR